MSRRRAAAALAGAIAAWLGILAPPATGAERAGQLFGFSDGSPVFPYEGAPSAAELAELEAAAGSEAGRFTIRWEEVQPHPPPPVGPPHLEFGPVDALVDALAARDIAPLPMVLGAPGWAREDDCSGVCPPSPEHAADWELLLRTVLARYPDAAALEVWNEPNLDAYWATPGESQGEPDPEAYAALLAPALARTRDVAPDTPILLGGLAYAAAEGRGSGMPLGEWLGRFYAAAPAAGVDLMDPRLGIAVHAYPGINEVDRLAADGRFRETLAAAREAIASGDPRPGRRRIWITEFGASSTAPAPPGADVDPLERQAAVIVAGLEELARSRDVAATLVYTAVDRPPPADPGQSSEEGFGVVGRGPELEPKPAYCAIAEWREEPAPDGC